MFPDYGTIKVLYDWNVLTPVAEWYVNNNYLTSEQYKEMTGKDFETAADASKD